MGRENPTAEELAYIDARIAYEDDCMAWCEGDPTPWPLPPLKKELSFRPALPSDDDAVWKIIWENYLKCCKKWKPYFSSQFPVPPRRWPGRPRAPRGRKPLFPPGSRYMLTVQIDVDQLHALDRLAQDKTLSRSALLRLIIQGALDGSPLAGNEASPRP